MPFGIQPWHIVAVVLVALVVFGPSKLPELGRSIGKTLNEFRNGAREMTESLKDEMNTGAPQSQSKAPVVTINPEPPAAEKPADPLNKDIFCGQCGSPNPADARFCKNCGKPLGA